MKKALIFVHKWLGVGLALLFLMWFASGIVMVYVPFPALALEERLAGTAPLRLDGCCLGAQEAAARAGIAVNEARLGMHGALPVWRVLGADKRWATLDARDGAALAALSDAEAMQVAQRFSGRRALHAERLERDQWTVAQGYNPHRPLVRVVMDGADGLELYVSPGAAEVVLDTRRAERAWNWVGAVPHWLYFTQLRRWPELWNGVVVWLSLPGVLLAVSGVVLGVWQLYLNRNRWIPYRKFWMRWHHILGLAAGVVCVTWILSGLLSMNPFGVFSPRGATPAERAAWSGAMAGAGEASINPARALAARPGAREIDLVQLQGQGWYRVRGAAGPADQVLVPADAAAGGAVLPALPPAAMMAALSGLRAGEAGAGKPVLSRLTEYDGLYYAREPAGAAGTYARPLPVWRAAWADGVTLYADPASARLLLRADAGTPWQRVLYNGLHSFDFAPLVARPMLRVSLLVGLCVLGLGLCVTACVLAWRVLVPARRRG
ncbi:PepSY domain-containing protein [Massilia sp. IC2-278]|uniref:PepSY domain-containing protein n=1 Tax=Massilia sp. IC2-278 TaxID=2887200 RepID=UPI001E506114|nr:PepSY domain-containing protein [Massilia sp. IC2-278]MCC2963311.1 PepSY domain-containing protein [Massilia sp. IC2-278]